MSDATLKIPPDTECPCKSGSTFAQCCGLYIGSKVNAPTAEALMRTRYSAYVLGDMDYLIRTIPLHHRKAFDRRSALAWSTNAEWLGLEVLSAKEYEAGKKGRVEFKAKFIMGGEEQIHHEIALFENVQSRWFFVDSKMLS
mgnify:CR=1 FL=1